MILKYFRCNVSGVIRNGKIAVLLIVLSAGFFSSCEKRNFEGTPATVLLFNALDNGTDLITNLTGTPDIGYKTALYLPNKNFQKGISHLNIVNAPQPLALYSSVDTLPKDAPILNINLDVQPGDIYSLFIYGPATAANYIWHKESIPAANMNDSITFVRFVNISENQDITLNLKDNATGSLISSLSFQEISEFIELKVDHSISSYEFEARDKSTGDLICTYTAQDINNFTSVFNQWFNRSNTLVFAGKPGGTGTDVQNLYLMNNQ